MERLIDALRLSRASGVAIECLAGDDVEKARRPRSNSTPKAPAEETLTRFSGSLAHHLIRCAIDYSRRRRPADARVRYGATLPSAWRLSASGQGLRDRLACRATFRLTRFEQPMFLFLQRLHEANDRGDSLLHSRRRRKIYRTVTLRLNCVGSRSAASHIVTHDAMLSVDISISCLNEIDIRTDARFPGYDGRKSGTFVRTRPGPQKLLGPHNPSDMEQARTRAMVSDP